MSEEFLAVQLDLPMRSAMVVSFLRRSAVAQGVGCCSAAVVALGVGSCSAALERSGVFAGQRRAAAAQLGSTGRWQRQRGVGSGSVVLAAAAWLQRSSAAQGVGQRGVGSGSVADAAQRRSAVLSSQGSAAQLSSAVRWQW